MLLFVNLHLMHFNNLTGGEFNGWAIVHSKFEHSSNPRSRTRLPQLASPTPRCQHIAPTVRNLSQGRLRSTGVDLHYFFFVLAPC